MFGVDYEGAFRTVFKDDNLKHDVQFLQLAADDREILPYVTMDRKSNQILFQLYDYHKNTIVS